MNFDMMQLAILAVYIFSVGVCIGKTFTEDKRIIRRTFISFIPLLNFFFAFCIIVLPLIDRLELYSKQKHDESDSIEW